jgi:hypothetical protein
MMEDMAEAFGATASWPTQIYAWADIIAAHNPSFDKDKFIRRATAKWEETYEPPFIDDEIIY